MLLNCQVAGCTAKVCLPCAYMAVGVPLDVNLNAGTSMHPNTINCVAHTRTRQGQDKTKHFYMQQKNWKRLKAKQEKEEKQKRKEAKEVANTTKTISTATISYFPILFNILH